MLGTLPLPLYSALCPPIKRLAVPSVLFPGQMPTQPEIFREPADAGTGLRNTRKVRLRTWRPTPQRPGHYLQLRLRLAYEAIGRKNVFGPTLLEVVEPVSLEISGDLRRPSGPPCDTGSEMGGAWGGNVTGPLPATDDRFAAHLGA